MQEREEKRENVRVKDRLQVTYRLIGPEDSASTASPEKFFPYIWSKYPQSIILEETEDTNSKILPHIIDLNRKIDILIELLANEKRPQVEVPATRDVCISASGMKIYIGESSNPGQRIALCIILPFVPPVQLFVTGEVTRSIPSDPVSGDNEALYETGIRFLDLKEEDCERIIKYIFKRQRDLLKDKKRLTDDGTSD